MSCYKETVLGTTINDFIKKKDYDYISIRYTLPEKAGGGDTFAGCAKSHKGKLIPLDYDTYDESDYVLFFEEWSNKEEGIRNGLTIVLDGEWYD